MIQLNKLWNFNYGVLGMKTELRIGLLLNALGLAIGRFMFFSEPVSGFLCGTFMGFGVFLIVVSLLPENVYNNLLYRKWITSGND
jgi:hypothetical protein